MPNDNQKVQNDTFFIYICNILYYIKNVKKIITTNLIKGKKFIKKTYIIFLMKNSQSSKNNFQIFMISLAIIFVILTITSFVIYKIFPKSIFLTFAISFGTTSYHFVMRLVVGFLINTIFHNNFDYTKKYFKEKKYERKLYKILKVKFWKDKMPSFNPELFNLQIHSAKKIASAMCQAEIVHTIIAVLSFLPIFASIFLGSFWIFFITSVLSCTLDMMFVVIQRFNRPRILKYCNLWVARNKVRA